MLPSRLKAVICTSLHSGAARRTRLRAVLTVFAVAGFVTGGAFAGGGPENVLLVIDSGNDESLYVGNYYRAARNIPGRNVIYIDPSAADYLAFTQFQLPALLGMLANRGVEDQIDYVVIPPGGSFFVSAPGLIDPGGCSAVTRLSLSSAYTLAFVADEILSGELNVFEVNRFFSTADDARAFDAEHAWLGGHPSTSPNARRYLIGTMLGYSGERGNTLEETMAMIDRSVAADGTRPPGTFYFLKTDDEVRSNPRDPHFPAAIAAIQERGGSAEQIEAFLPLDRHDCLGILTGVASPAILEADLTILPGAFCDHLTSFAGTFDAASQTKMSEWIAKGASGSMGTVEEPCVFGEGIPGKFPHPRLHVWYFQGVSLGEALLRSIQWAPFQCLFYGDPLTRTFAHLPEVDVPDAPAGPVSGEITLTPQATTTLPDGQIASFDLIVDGLVHASIPAGESFTLDTLLLADGRHDLRVIAFEDTAVATQGRWLSTLEVNNQGRFVTTSVSPASGDLSTLFSIDVAAGGGVVSELRLLHNGRVLAAAATDNASFSLFGRRFGAGTVELTAVADFDDGSMAMSEPVVLEISFAEPAGDEPAEPSPPIAYSYRLDVLPGQPFLLDLPATDADGDELSLTILIQPTQAVVESGGGTFLLTPFAQAEGEDTLTFQADDGMTPSNVATVTIRYCAAPEITGSPADQEGCVDEPVAFEVIAVGNLLSYQWFKDEAVLPGETNALLMFDSIGPGDAGEYAVDVTGRCSGTLVPTTVRSEPAVLTVVDPPKILEQPEGADLCTGESYVAFVGAGGTAPEFQWFLDGVALPGATEFFLFIPAATPSDQGAYTAELTNSCGVATTEPAELTVAGCGAGDADADGDVDFADMAVLQICFTGSGAGTIPKECEVFDFDADGDIDLRDFEDTLLLTTGPG